MNFTRSFTLTPSEVFEWVSDCCYFFSQLYHGKNTLILNEMMIEGLTVPFVVIGQPCIKRSHSEQRKGGRLRQVTSWNRFKSYEIFCDRTRKRLPFNTCDCLIEATGWSGLTVYYPPLLFILFQLFMVNINDKGKKGSPLWGITPPKRASAFLFRRNQIYNSPYGRKEYFSSSCLEKAERLVCWRRLQSIIPPSYLWQSKNPSMGIIRFIVCKYKGVGVRVMVFNATFNNVSVISCRCKYKWNTISKYIL